MRCSICWRVAGSTLGRALYQPPPKGLVQGDQIAHGIAAADQVIVLLLEQGALRIQHPLEVRITFAVLGVGQHQRTLGGDLRPRRRMRSRSSDLIRPLAASSASRAAWRTLSR